MAFFVVLLYLKSLYHGYDYYFGDSGIFWNVIFFICYHGPLLDGLAATLSQLDVGLPGPLTPRCPEDVIGLASVPHQQPPSPMPLQAYANYAMGSPQIGFFFRVELPTVLYIICLVSGLVSAF